MAGIVTRGGTPAAQPESSPMHVESPSTPIDAGVRSGRVVVDLFDINVDLFDINVDSREINDDSGDINDVSRDINDVSRDINDVSREINDDLRDINGDTDRYQRRPGASHR